ncbi:hypothetical protein A2926_01980 [Candidatus Giovannonibacteria bacterium RIFCSPLOWO2_01_FULL_44_40]|uniref:Methyltransferase FkbM domain-containing protein n=1 Tax=Candidatus Giovannonibacteria bacterium RIFCSPHIGHO2_01_FULL_45_23 TaxID=1798325 RepID=A0A1F5VGD8_9BACT|nr:MAG: hypothetical protein A2834_03350 [Candidatus Giovannonibacteria bacterium RIFCSPHIGHO2_01_FULL_45_23]OGF76925.1 MAG: hypothetical protein A3C77_04840 [Candidatus Giovannonibacteria bacterium RIFCSPHIGHO2_02_FULL_45_13]OGF80296.1 MAG: hypothetical protein A2926_01980 [Candidatus Giovannonibacteria bacterium RIFCSPLOWO2_01_FULL_44_40]
MGQTTQIFPKAKKLYKKVLNSPTADRAVRGCLNLSVNLLAAGLGWNFPKKFDWDWKLEMLLHKYEADTFSLFKKNVKPGMTVIDIGAHIGYYTVLFSKLVGPSGKVFAFEPDAENFALLCKNTNGLKNVSLVNKAVADSDGEITFYKINQSTGCHSIVTPRLPSQKISVLAIRLDTFLAQNNIAEVDVIKIDIEGGEPFAFRGMDELFSKSRELMVVSEFSPKSLINLQIQPENFLKQIQNYGFSVYRILNGGGLEALAVENLADLEFYKTGYTNLAYLKRTA